MASGKNGNNIYRPPFPWLLLELGGTHHVHQSRRVAVATHAGITILTVAATTPVLQAPANDQSSGPPPGHDVTFQNTKILLAKMLAHVVHPLSPSVVKAVL